MRVHRYAGYKLNELEDLLIAMPPTYAEVRFPLLFDRGVFSWGGDSSFHSFSKEGLTYLLYRLTSWEDNDRWVDRDKARELYNAHRMTEFVQYINNCRGWQATENQKRADEKLIAAYLPTGIGRAFTLWGLMTDYNPYTNKQVLDMTTTVVGKIDFWQWEPTVFNLYLKTGFIVPFDWGLCIRNGETGHATLGYHLYVHAKGSLYWSTVPLNRTRRHLSLVSDAVNNIQQAIEEVHGLELDNTVCNTPLSKYLYVYNTAGWERVREWTEGFAKRPVIDWLSFLSGKLYSHGEKTIARRAIDTVLAEVSLTL